MHTGPHPVTLRSFSTPEQRRTSFETTPSCPATSQSPLRTDETTESPAISASTPMRLTSDGNTTIAALEAENATLKTRVEELDHQLKCAIDHSIENDARLLRYTNEIFSVNSSNNVATDVGVMEVPQSVKPLKHVECAVQCDEHSACDSSLIENLKTTIQVLEAELECLRTEALNCTCKNIGPWLLCVERRKTSRSIGLQNKFKNLECIEECDPPNSEITYQANKRGRGLQHSKNPKTGVTSRNISRSQGIIRNHSAKKKHTPCTLNKFSSVLIESDSHGRHITGMVKDLIGSGLKVTGMCKPGAGLLQVASSEPPGNGVSVIIAGTNDIAAGRQNTIFQHLERLVMRRLKTSKVVIATLPRRHDLPNRHIVHRNTESVNRLIYKVAERNAGVEVLDFNKVPRSMFTRHGMHLRMPGKR